MPNITPLLTSRPDNIPLWPPVITAGIATGLPFTANTPGTNYSVAAINVPGVKQTSVVTGVVQNGTFADTFNARIIAVQPSTDTIAFLLTAQPSDVDTFQIGWAVLKF
jgi:hypothetical protein